MIRVYLAKAFLAQTLNAPAILQTPTSVPVLAFAYPNMNISSNGGALSFSTGQFVMVVDNDGSQQVIGAIQINTVTNEGTYYYIQPETSAGNGCTDLSGANSAGFH